MSAAKVKKVDHLGIVVSDLDQAVRFYEGQLGVACTNVEEMPARGIKVAFLPVGDMRIELIALLRPDGEVSKFLATRGPGLHHLCFETQDVHAGAQGLQAAGVSLTGPVSAGAHHTQVVFVHPKATGGVLVELAQLPKP